MPPPDPARAGGAVAIALPETGNDLTDALALRHVTTTPDLAPSRS